MSEALTAVVLTVLRDEHVSVARWLEHWTQAVGRDNIIVFDATTTGSDGAGPTVFRLPQPAAAGENAVADLLDRFGRGLLEVYGWVITVEPDEGLEPNPAEFADLRAYLAARAGYEAITPAGLEAARAPMLRRTTARWYEAGDTDAPHLADPALSLLDLTAGDTE